MEKACFVRSKFAAALAFGLGFLAFEGQDNACDDRGGEPQIG